MLFLGMDRDIKPKKKKKKSIWDDDPISFMEQTYEMRRQAREESTYLFEKERKNLEDEIRRVEAEDIMEYEIRKRQDWIQKYKEEHNGKPPDKMDKYDDRLFSGDPMTAEELAAL